MVLKFMLAPLEDTSDNAFRDLCFKHGADLTFTEMTRLKGIIRGNPSTMKKIDLLNGVPTQLQFAVQSATDLNAFLSKYEPPKGFQGINFNLGCPSPHLIKVGLGCAMMKRVSKVNSLVKVVHDFGFSASLKMRLGLNSYEKSKKVFLNLINGADAEFYVVHARHGAEHYESPADFSVFPECVDTGRKIVANGDIDSIDKVNDLKKLGVYGVMIGRAAVYDPSIFERFKTGKGASVEEIKKEYSEISDLYHTDIFYEKYKNNFLKRLGQKKIPDEESNVQG